MLENIDDAISVRRLSSTLGVSERTLRYGFQDLFGMSPLKYLKTVRLHRARQSLQRANSSRTTVLREAMRSGFWHLSRFSSEYKNYFGELPSATLRG
jgi:AraC family ethanolamine operon transcriptional activator